jgi:hypothetical protein
MMSSINDFTEIRRWYDEYIAANDRQLTPNKPLILAVQKDEFDVVAIEKRIEDLRPNTVVTGRFCNDCQALFDNWPDLSDSATVHPDGTKCFPGAGADWKHAVARSFHTIQLEAAARNGCRFCALLVQKLRDTEQLRIFHQIDARIESLGETAKAHMSLQNWGKNQDQLLWVNWPGKISDHCNGGTGPTQKLVVGALDSDGELTPGPGPIAHLDALNTDFSKLLPTMRIETCLTLRCAGYKIALRATRNATKSRSLSYPLGSCIPANIRSALYPLPNGKAAVVSLR